MRDKFKVETERINSTYVIRVYKEDEIIMEILNWNSLSSSNAEELEELVDLMNQLYRDNQAKNEEIQFLKEECLHLHKRLATYGRVKSALTNMKESIEKIWEFEE